MIPSPLITPQELLRERPDVCLLDVRGTGPGDKRPYEQSHLKGALDVDLDRDLAAPAGSEGRHPLPPIEVWSRQLGEWGIGPDTDVVVYDDSAGARAARAWWMIRAVGHGKVGRGTVSLLDGGLQAARAAGVATESAAPNVESQPPYPATSWTLPIVSIDEVEARRLDSKWRIVDVREPARFRGEVEPLDPVAGRIPGAMNLPFRDNLKADGRFKSAAELTKVFKKSLGDVPARQVIVHCGSGVTACHMLLALEHVGMHGAALYVGSWSEWCDSEYPIITRNRRRESPENAEDSGKNAP